MRPAILLAIVGALLIGAAWNTAALFDATASIYASGTVRRCFTIGASIAGIAAGIAALAAISRAGERRLEKDFPAYARSKLGMGCGPIIIDDDADVEVGGIGATDYETVRRQ